MCVIGSFIMCPTSFTWYVLVCITDVSNPDSESLWNMVRGLVIWTSNEANKFLAVHFEFPFELIDQSNNTF